MPLTSLLSQHCQPLQGVPAMSEAQFKVCLAQFTEIDGWQWAQGAIERSVEFENFHETMAFVNELAHICHEEDHHPTLTITYQRCVMRFDTHSVGGVSMNDLICAAKVNALITRGLISTPPQVP
jgi:4a-hydroxytetrahydrobiopterin dehydratase